MKEELVPIIYNQELLNTLVELFDKTQPQMNEIVGTLFVLASYTSLQLGINKEDFLKVAEGFYDQETEIKNKSVNLAKPSTTLH